ncbi:MAG: sulfatase-like hydrolase/transferase [Candidatus Omnitrophica bacterium]|nr:sulfatase-like hydrolase/transferase [Candidatus Omnitrophota bacterium]
MNGQKMLYYLQVLNLTELILHRAFFLDTNSSPLKTDIESLPLLLRKHGYYTIAFVSNNYASVDTLGIRNGYDIAPPIIVFRLLRNSLRSFVINNAHRLLSRLYEGKIKYYDWIIREDFVLSIVLQGISHDFSETDAPPEEIFNSFLETIEQNHKEPFFAWLHIFPPHDPYLPPEPYMGMFDASQNLRTFRSMWFATNNIGEPHLVKDTEATNRTLRDRYDEFIRYCDVQFEEFMKQLRLRNKLKNTIIILSSDHGEGFLEHNYYGHGGALWEEVTHIPLIIKEPDKTEGRVIDSLTSLIDVPATILDLAKIPIPSWMEGRSLVPFMRGKERTAIPVFSMVLQANPSQKGKITKGMVAVWEGNYKLIHYLDKGNSIMFNLKEDPNELNDLFDKRQAIGQHLLLLIKENLEKVNEVTYE